MSSYNVFGVANCSVVVRFPEDEKRFLQTIVIYTMMMLNISEGCCVCTALVGLCAFVFPEDEK